MTILQNRSDSRRRAGERGYVLATMAVAAIALFGALGMAVDFGRMFIVKNETQAYCDSAALAAAQRLDGTTTGIANAQTAVTNSLNTWNFNSTQITGTLKFATAAAGPWVANPNPATGYEYTQVTTTVTMPLYFLPVVVSQSTQNVSSAAVAGQVPFTSTFPQGLAPYSAVSTNTTGPNFGLTIGTSYDIQWPNYNDTRAGCPGNPDKCFVSPPCAGDKANNATETAVVTNWGASISGYWGSSSNNTIQQEILDLQQLAAVAPGTNIGTAGLNLLTSGNKASEAGYLDQRASEDIDTTDNTVSSYLAAVHNGRRLIPVPIVDPVDPTHTNVSGYGVFLLMANGPGTSNYYTKTTNGNDPFCALYAGTYIIGGTGPGAGGAGGTSGAYRIKLVQ